MLLRDEIQNRINALKGNVINVGPENRVPPTPSPQITVRQVTTGNQKTDLHAANHQWATRPADERFWSLAEMAVKIRSWKDRSEEQVIDASRLRVVAHEGDLLLEGGGLILSKFTNWSFSQLCSRSRLPECRPALLQALPAPLAAEVLNHGFDSHDGDSMALIRNPGSANQKIAALTSTGYSRIWNADIVGKLLHIENAGWRVPPARPSSMNDPRMRLATEDDVLKFNKGGGGISVKIGDPIAPAGLYASDRDCFVFMVSENSIDPGDGGLGLNRGFFMSNSEVGNASFSLTTFLYDAVCGNHIVWGASNVTEVKLVHRGKANERWSDDMRKGLYEYQNESGDEQKRLIQAAMRMNLGDNKNDVIEAIFGQRALGINKRDAGEAFDLAVMESDIRGNRFAPQSVWGMVCGLTRLSQSTGFADKRTAIDKAAGRLLMIAG